MPADALRWILLGVTILLGLALLVLLVVGWARRSRRQRDVAALPIVPELTGDPPEFRVKYVATTSAGAPFDRIASSGLGFRGNAVASVHEEGLLIRRTGEADIWIGRADLIGVDRATWTIDRVVEPDGLHLVRWRLGEREVDTYLRFEEPKAFDRAMEGMEAAK